MKKKNCTEILNQSSTPPINNCTKIVNLPGPYQSPTLINKSLNLLNKELTINMRVNMGDSYSNTTSYGLLQMIGQAPQCGNLYVWVSSGKFLLGVQCNGNGSDSPLNSTTTLVGNQNYDLKVKYDGKIASIYVNGKLEASASKKFNYYTDVSKVVVGAGNLNLSGEVMPTGASISNIIVNCCK